MELKKICKWIKEIAEEKPETFAEYFIDDIYHYLQIEDVIDAELEKNLKKICGTKFYSLKKCNSKENVKEWLNNITSFITMKLDVENIICDYFAK